MHKPSSNDIGGKTIDALASVNSVYYKPLQSLGMAKKAGLLTIGNDAVKSEARVGKVKLIVVASDVSEGSKKQAMYSAEDSNALCIETPYKKFDFGRVVGRGSPGVVAILDDGFALSFMKKLADVDKEKYYDIADTMEKQIRAAKNQANKSRRINK